MQTTTSLALNMIVGAGEAFELNRCLESVCVEGLFDEIVIVPTSHDLDVEKVAKKFTDKVFYFEWMEDFSAARNYALKHTTTKHVMWLDADDVVNEITRSRLLRLKRYISHDNHDIYLIPYHLDFNDQGEFIQYIPRDRVFKRRKNLKWQYRVHEQLTTEQGKHSVASFNGISVEHRPTKDGRFGLERNIKILQEEYLKDPSNGQYAFYYARDLYLLERFDDAIQIFDQIIKDRAGTESNLHMCALNIALYYTYNGDGSLKEDTIGFGENYARIAMSFSDRHAESYVILGDIYHFKGQLEEAMTFFKTAMSKKLDGHGLQQIPFYEEIPADRLARIYADSNDYAGVEQALFYNKTALKHSPNDQKLIDNRKQYIQQLLKGEENGMGS